MPKSKFKIDEIALVLVVAFIAMIAGIYNKSSKPIEMEAEKITGIILDDHEASFASNGIVNEAKLRKIKEMRYSDFKKYLNIQNDFCIYVEDSDGRVILAKGWSKLNKDGLVCRE